MKKGIFLAIIGAIAAAILLLYPRSKTNEYKIGIVLPMQHAALDDIVAGFKSELSAALGNIPFSIDVQNAMGDINLQKSALNKFINDRVDMLVPVTKSTTLMAINLAPPLMPVLFLAANIPPESETAKSRPTGLMGVIDEIPVALQLKFMRTALPHIKQIAIVYSSSDKVFDDVEEFSKTAQQAGISMQKLMVQNLSELYTISSRIEPSNQAIFILKDNLVASGIATLVQQANHLHIPLITSDEGTVKQGATFAVGVIEANIGRQGASIAASYFKQTQDRAPIIEINTPIQYLKSISVFINKSACLHQGINPADLSQAASTLNLTIIDG